MRVTHLDLLLAPGALSVRFQPIFAISGPHPELHSVEALIRGPRGTNLEEAPVLFEYCRARRRELDMDRACIASIFREAAHLPANLPFSINIHASSLRHPELVDFISQFATRYDLDLRRLCVEIVEQLPPWNLTALQESLEQLRKRGASLALDDFGEGFSNLRMLLDTRPDYLKLDAYLLQGMAADPRRRHLLRALVQLTEPLGTCLVAEGVENAEDLEFLRTIGVPLCQGFLLGEPVGVGELLTTAPEPTTES